jgi:kinesin family protein 4/21/27
VSLSLIVYCRGRSTIDTFVLSLLSAGSTLRQTGATDMNAQSSRSHAIFSLTITQRKWTGSGSPPSPSSITTSPTSPRVQNRLSGIPRVTSPTPGARPSTPSGRPGSRSGLRPPSMIGRPQSPGPLAEDFPSNGIESWSVVTSKFHFVDLAGSERVSLIFRTAYYWNC